MASSSPIHRMDQESWETWLSDLEMEDEDFLKRNSSQDDVECVLRDILQHSTNFSTESEAVLSPIVADGGAFISNLVNSKSSNNSIASETPPTTYILSFDNSTVIPAIPEPNYNYLNHSNDINISLKPKSTRSSLLSSKRNLEDLNHESRTNGGTKKARSSSETIDHIMAERRRRQELTERFIALSATIPGLKKIDKASILSEAINYVKQLQERVRELEEETKKIMKKSQVYAEHTDGGISSSEINSDDCYTPNDALPEVKARISENKQVLIRILCHKQKCTMLKILDELKNLHLNVFGNSAMPFGSSTLDITIIAQMREECSITVKDVVKSLRIALLK